MSHPRELLRDPVVYQVAAAGQAADAAACIGPIPYVARCLDSVDFPAEHRWIFPVVKAASAVGLAAAPRFPGLARLTSVMLTIYFVLAVGSHVRARDIGLNFAASSSMLALYSTLAVTGPPQDQSVPSQTSPA
ncbi:DoxX family protein [Gordonia liuliyuniae]|uniref:DoxX family protein n=1 Tax=Gordonia liuliyuniae TaxID=2911517 RepID=A0ABS9IX28_9ACTN|nr:DoxX family protein [Gordonia liuliyuniae]MCF8590106.1 DoxX family protein [Gordonia liuliyuniae]